MKYFLSKLFYAIRFYYVSSDGGLAIRLSPCWTGPATNRYALVVVYKGIRREYLWRLDTGWLLGEYSMMVKPGPRSRL